MVRVASEPVLLHAGEKLLGDRITRTRADNGVNAAAWTKRTLIGSRDAVIRRLLDPVFDLGRLENSQAVETATALTLKNLRAMPTAMLVRCNDV